MPITQWEYNNMLRLDCNPLGPPAEDWRIELHDMSSGKVRSLFPALLQQYEHRPPQSAARILSTHVRHYVVVDILTGMCLILRGPMGTVPQNCYSLCADPRGVSMLCRF